MIETPPQAYLHPYDGPVIETVMTAADVQKYCRNKDALACTLFYPAHAGDKCFIYLPVVGKGGVAPRTQQLLREHEEAHCNGWPRNHPKGAEGTPR
ncbi:hypothetical protein IC762_09660 [Bradyrhizobium genosp. L]|uniref:hypothetical protein n=1 Tax=Bradyrhizobium genosp. L TaxID=83637 RepID=UPI0018A2D79E|nr:hypothetical protein [Bradyrhizobium genosp. L]QPF86521.1 hypothetical protein IC762_09660 [Bradyrhizobium genosp. L]